MHTEICAIWEDVIFVSDRGMTHHDSVYDDTNIFTMQITLNRSTRNSKQYKSTNDQCPNIRIQSIQIRKDICNRIILIKFGMEFNRQLLYNVDFEYAQTRSVRISICCWLSFIVGRFLIWFYYVNWMKYTWKSISNCHMHRIQKA